MKRTISDKERTRRAGLVAAARRTVELEGWRSSDAARALQDAFVRGEVDLDELAAQAQDGTSSAHGPRFGAGASSR